MHVSETCTGPDGSKRHHRSWRLRRGLDRRGQSSELFQHLHQERLSSSSTRVAGNAPSGHVHRHASERTGGDVGRFTQCKVHGHTPEHGGHILGDSKVPRDPSNGRTDCSWTIHNTGNAEARQSGREGSRVSSSWRPDVQLWPRQRRKRSRLLGSTRRQRRAEGQEQGQERKRKRMAAKWFLGKRRKRLEPEQGETGGKAEGLVSMNPALARAVEPLIVNELESLTFHALIGLCTTIQMMGCALAWLLINLPKGESRLKAQRIFWTVINTGARNRAERRRSALPIREGDLSEVRTFLQERSLKECLLPEAVARYGSASWEMMACYACNSLCGVQRPLQAGPWNNNERVAYSAVKGAVDRLLKHGHDVVSTVEAVEKDFKLARVSYQGEEVGSCHSLTLRQVSPALPPMGHGGCIELINYVSDFTRKMLLDPGSCLLPDDGRKLPKLQGKIHIASGEVDSIAEQLVSRGICDWIPLDSVVRYRGQRVLNGMFGVPKPSSIETGEPILRLIMNLVPANSIMLQLQGATLRLPSIMTWMSIVTDGTEKIRIWQSDMSNAFYLFKLPSQWQNYLAFNIIRDGSTLGRTEGMKFALSCKVLPMGWLSSVSVMQEISEKLLVHDALSTSSQLVKNRPLPLWVTGLLKEARECRRDWWHVYLDNFCAGQVLGPDELPSGGDILHQLAEK